MLGQVFQERKGYTFMRLEFLAKLFDAAMSTKVTFFWRTFLNKCSLAQKVRELRTPPTVWIVWKASISNYAKCSLLIFFKVILLLYTIISIEPHKNLHLFVYFPHCSYSLEDVVKDER